jgi:DNA-binding response OmpR family regulator
MSNTILIIEDNPKNAALMRRVLEKHSYAVLLAEDGETGLKVALAERPDLILLDLGLPDVDGQTVAGWLKQGDALPDTPLVVVTAWPGETARQMVSAYGCEGYIPKPIDTREFPHQIASYLGRRAS